jgi:hypothetical protein
MEVLLGLPPLHLQVEVEPRYEITDYVTMNKVNQNLKVLDVHT